MNDIDETMKEAMFLTNEFVNILPLEGVMKNDIRKMAVSHISKFLLSDVSVSLDVKKDAFLQTLNDLKDTPSLAKVFPSNEEFHHAMDEKINEHLSHIKKDLEKKLVWGSYGADSNEMKVGFVRTVRGLMQNQKFHIKLADNRLSADVDEHNKKIMTVAAQEFIVEHNFHQQMHYNFLVQILNNATQYHNSLLSAFVQDVVQVDPQVAASPVLMSTQRLKRGNP